MPAFGDVNTPADQLIWRQLVEKETHMRQNAQRVHGPGGFSLRCAVSREEVPVLFKPGHLDPNAARACKGFDPKAYGWDPKGELATEFRRCRKRSTEECNKRFLFPETTAQENGWCLKAPKPRRTASLVSLPADAKRKEQDSVTKAAKAVRLESETAQRRRRKEGEEVSADAEKSESKLGLGKWASESQLSASRPNGTELSAMPPSYVSAMPPSMLSATAPSDLSKATSWPGVAKELVLRAREQDNRIEKTMQEYRRYLCYGDRGNKHFHPLGETDATAYANAFTKATSGVPPHKWDPRAAAAPPAD